MNFLRPSVSNGLPREQALIRRWWHEQHSARGRIVWEYHMEGKFADAVWFPDVSCSDSEESGKDSSRRFPLADMTIVLCEAKKDLTPEVVGQALVYARFASRAGALVREVVVFAESGHRSMQEAGSDLGLKVIVRSLD